MNAGETVALDAKRVNICFALVTNDAATRGHPPNPPRKAHEESRERSFHRASSFDARNLKRLLPQFVLVNVQQDSNGRKFLPTASEVSPSKADERDSSRKGDCEPAPRDHFIKGRKRHSSPDSTDGTDCFRRSVSLAKTKSASSYGNAAGLKRRPSRSSSA